MAVKLRLARFGSKGKPYYHIVATDSRSPRDGKYLETVGKYNPLLKVSDNERTSLKTDRAKYWLSVGAVPSDKVYKILANLGLLEKKIYAEQTKGHLPKAKAQARLKAKTAANQTVVEEVRPAEVAVATVEAPVVEVHHQEEVKVAEIPAEAVATSIETNHADTTHAETNHAETNHAETNHAETTDTKTASDHSTPAEPETEVSAEESVVKKSADDKPKTTEV